MIYILVCIGAFLLGGLIAHIKNNLTKNRLKKSELMYDRVERQLDIAITNFQGLNSKKIKTEDKDTAILLGAWDVFSSRSSNCIHGSLIPAPAQFSEPWISKNLKKQIYNYDELKPLQFAKTYF